ncbi:MAG: septum formation initiator family protein [Firmicutes bacterium]|nr:septum formation initiator family protein [Bacillota bacterium]
MKGKVIRYPGRPKKGILMRKIILIMLVLSLVVFSLLFWGQTRSYQQIKEEADILEAGLEGLRAENELLKKEAGLLKKKDYIEVLARKQLGMVRPGEIIFHIED